MVDLNERPIRRAEFLGAQAAVGLNEPGPRLKPRVLLGFYCPATPSEPYVTHNLAVAVADLPRLMERCAQILVDYLESDATPADVARLAELGVLDRLVDRWVGEAPRDGR